MSLLPEINQASAEINKFVAQANIHQTIAPVNPAEFTSPADTLLLASRDPVIREVSVGMTGVEAVQRTVSGTPPLSLTNSLGKPLKAWEVDVVPKQDLNGYDSPWPAGGGKNLFNGDNYISGTLVPIHLAQGTEITASVSYTTSTVQVYYYGANETYLDYWTLTSENPAARKARTFTIANGDCEYMKFVGDGIQDVQVELGSTVTSYTPYSNICPIYGTDKLNMFVEESYDQSATPKAVITLPQTVYTGTIGSEGGESRWGEVDLGTKTWTKESSGSYYFFYSDVSAKADNYNFKCSQYKTVEKIRTQLSDCDIGLYYNSGNYWKRLVIRDDSKSDMTGAQFKTAMEGVQLVCELATPTTFAVPSPTIPTPTGTATTWATAEDGTVDSMEVTYYKSE